MLKGQPYAEAYERMRKAEDKKYNWTDWDKDKGWQGKFVTNGWETEDYDW